MDIKIGRAKRRFTSPLTAKRRIPGSGSAALAVVANAHVELVARIAVANTVPATLAESRGDGMALLERDLQEAEGPRSRKSLQLEHDRNGQSPAMFGPLHG